MASDIGVGIIGTGFMGAAHALAFRTAPVVFDTKLRPRLEVIADINLDAAQAAAARHDIGRAVQSWQELIDDPKVEIVSITTPNALHRDIADRGAQRRQARLLRKAARRRLAGREGDGGGGASREIRVARRLQLSPLVPRQPMRRSW